MSKPPIPGKSATPDETRLVMLGTISKPQGLKGGVRMWPEFDNPDDFEQLKTDRLFLKPAGSASSLRPKPSQYFEITLDEFYEHQRFLVLKFDGINDPDAAESLRDCQVYVYEEEMWELAEGQYYTWQLVGLDIYDEITGQVVGAVTGFRAGVQDYLVATSDGKEFLLPHVPEIVTSIDLQQKRITAKIPEGLTDL